MPQRRQGCIQQVVKQPRALKCRLEQADHPQGDPIHTRKMDYQPYRWSPKHKAMRQRRRLPTDYLPRGKGPMHNVTPQQRNQMELPPRTRANEELIPHSRGRASTQQRWATYFRRTQQHRLHSQQPRAQQPEMAYTMAKNQELSILCTLTDITNTALPLGERTVSGGLITTRIRKRKRIRTHLMDEEDEAARPVEEGDERPGRASRGGRKERKRKRRVDRSSTERSKPRQRR